MTNTIILISTFEENKIFIDVDNDKEITEELRRTLKGKIAVHGDDYVDDDFFRIKKTEILIDITNQFYYAQEDENTILMRRLLDKQVISTEEDGLLTTFNDEFRFNGKIKELKKQLESNK